MIDLKILAVDLGDARTGLAACDRTEFLASPLCVISEWNEDKVISRIAAAAEEIDAKMIVVGHPINMDGSRGERAEKCERAAEKLKEITSLPIVLWDERQTTVEAHAILHANGKKEKQHRDVVDAVAATLILENYLAYRKNNK